jgi:hypothetical protein
MPRRTKDEEQVDEVVEEPVPVAAPTEGERARGEVVTDEEVVHTPPLPHEAPYWVWRDGAGGFRVFNTAYPHFGGGDPVGMMGQPDVSGSLEDVMAFIREDAETEPMVSPKPLVSPAPRPEPAVLGTTGTVRQPPPEEAPPPPEAA